ncbi:hypothetical protein ES695_06390 [Candidatus Atribacteria bacterium 1244-E10-H5-B2]|nr:MAG: hypothetical protein ES695_06390 [Candidatus Atribacteria bacterium 1244-E10-H5-B2]
MIKRYPHTATLSYHIPGTYSTAGIYTEGSTVTTVIACNIQPNSTRYIIGESGDMIGYSWFVSSPIFSGAGSVPKAAKLTFFSKEHIILQLFEYQKHIEMKC